MSDTLPFGFTHARATDPATSKAAAASAIDIAEGHCAVIHSALRRFPVSGATVSDLARLLPHLSRHQINKRLPDLRMQGLAHATKETREGATGRAEQVWLDGPDPDPQPRKPTTAQQIADLERRVAEQGRRIAELEARRA